MSKTGFRTKLTAIALAVAAQAVTAAPIISVEPEADAVRVVVIDAETAAKDLEINLQIDGRLVDFDLDDVVVQLFGENGIAFDISDVEAGSRLIEVAAISPTSYTTSVALVDIDSSVSKSKGINYRRIWRTATRMARRGIRGGVIKLYLEREGYICPRFLPWLFCARPAGG